MHRSGSRSMRVEWTIQNNYRLDLWFNHYLADASQNFQLRYIIVGNKTSNISMNIQGNPIVRVPDLCPYDGISRTFIVCAITLTIILQAQ